MNFDNYDWDCAKRRQEDEYNGRWGGRWSEKEIDYSTPRVTPILRPSQWEGGLSASGYPFCEWEPSAADKYWAEVKRKGGRVCNYIE